MCTLGVWGGRSQRVMIYLRNLPSIRQGSNHFFSYRKTPTVPPPTPYFPSDMNVPVERFTVPSGSITYIHTRTRSSIMSRQRYRDLYRFGVASGWRRKPGFGHFAGMVIQSDRYPPLKVQRIFRNTLYGRLSPYPGDDPR